MRDPLGGLTDAQRRAATHPGGPLLVLGGAGTGKTRTLLARFAWLVAHDQRPESILVVTEREAAAERLRGAVESGLDRAYEELPVFSIDGVCRRLLRDEALEAGLDPFAVPLTPADRLAMLLDRIGELTLRVHDFRGDATALVGSFVRRIDRLKAEGITAEEYAAWAEGLPEVGDAERTRAAREREFAGLFAAHERMLAEAGTLDGGDVVLTAVRVLREKAHVRARTAARWRHLLVDDLEELPFAHGLLVRLLASEHGNLVAAADDDAALGRLRAAAAKNVRDFRTEHPEAETVTLELSLRCGAAVVQAARAVVAPAEDRLRTKLDGALGGEVAFWRCANERAQAQAVAA
ncbi:MAG: UvrD/REP helicase, partial [Solirubrobacterales bacterium]|nr:UvrD/REP helicase [Solirubrobacterales bacterium]